MVNTNCPARLARFRLELRLPEGHVPPEPLTDARSSPVFPCIESTERPGRCLHCQQPTLRAAGEPHGPFCTSIDAGCRECRRIQDEARRAAGKPPLPHITPALLEEWRSDADRWQRLYGNDPECLTLACQRIATLIATLNDARAAATEIGMLALDKASELETRLEAIRLELRALNEKQKQAEALRIQLFGPPKRTH